MPSARDMWCCDECADNFDETQSDRIKWKLFVWMGIWSFTGTGRALKLYVHAANLSLAVPCFFRVSGFTGLMKVRVKWLLSLPQLNLNWENTWAVQICVLTHQGPHLKSRNNLVLHILGGFDGSQAALFYCIKYTLQIKSSKLQGNLISWLWHKWLCHVNYMANKRKYHNDISGVDYSIAHCLCPCSLSWRDN